MKVVLLALETKSPDWLRDARLELTTKLEAFLPFELQLIKSPSGSRDNAEAKRRMEGERLLKQITPRDLLILFDEKGRLAKSTEDFTSRLQRVLESGKTRIVFGIGGPYGFSEDVRARADQSWSLSPLTMNHWVAQIVALEQLYRAMTILNRIPYHNA